MAINLKKVLCTSVVGALLVCSNAYAGTVEVTNNTNDALTLTVEGGKGKVFAPADIKTPLQKGETKTITINAKDVEGAADYTLSATGMTDGKCTSLAIDGDYTATFTTADKVGTNCVSVKR